MKTIITNVQIFSPNSSANGLKNACICIKDGKITHIGERPADFTPEAVIDGRGGLAMPALINAHTHSYMTVLRNFADDLPFADWLFGRIMPAEDKLTPSDAYWGCMLACLEMLKTGTGTFCDMHMFPGVTPRAALKFGMRAVAGRGLSGGIGDNGGKRRLAEARAEIQEFSGQPLISFAAAPHSVYTCDGEHLKAAGELAREYSLPLHIHLSESPNEVKNCIKEHGMTPPAYLDSLGLLGEGTLAAHCVHLTDDDIALLAERGASVVSCPKSNLKLGNGTARLKELFDAGVNVCLGTDSAASNNSLNMFSEINFAALLQKGRTGDPAVLPAPEVLSFATKNAAKALGLENLGSLKPGFYADIAILRTDTPSLNPLTDPAGALVYSVSGAEVDTVIINGTPVLRAGKAVFADEEEIYYNVRKIAEKLA